MKSLVGYLAGLFNLYKLTNQFCTSCIFFTITMYTCRPLTKSEMDALYAVYKDAHRDNRSLVVHGYDIVSGRPVAERRILDPTDFTTILSAANAVSGLMQAVFSQFDVVTALSVVAALESRASYDPTFRTSFPKVLRGTSWFL